MNNVLIPVNTEEELPPLFDWTSISRREDTARYEEVWTGELPAVEVEGAGGCFAEPVMCESTYQPRVPITDGELFWTYLCAREPEDGPRHVPILFMRNDARAFPAEHGGVADTICGEVSNTAVFESELARLEAHYDFGGKADVREFVRAHPQLLALLMEARGEIESRFPGANVTLRLLTDPEIPNRKDLYVGIETDLCVNDALSRLGELDEAWWLDRAAQADGLMCVDVELR